MMFNTDTRYLISSMVYVKDVLKKISTQGAELKEKDKEIAELKKVHEEKNNVQD